MPEIEVHAPPRGQQRHKTGHGREYTPTSTLEAQRLIREEWQRAGFGVQKGAVTLEVRTWFARPVGHFGTGRNASVLRPSAPQWPITRSSFDFDNLGKLVADALTGYAFKDDARIVSGCVTKRYCRDGEVPGWKIGVYSMEEE